jgi:hypothetical protein
VEQKGTAGTRLHPAVSGKKRGVKIVILPPNSLGLALSLLFSSSQSYCKREKRSESTIAPEDFRKEWGRLPRNTTNEEFTNNSREWLE